ncbi:unnamed protein product [Nippostrongylus brasiliensis]|uniref:CCA tRNA nucleotidyltransferase 1, mitochondrial (inferred by orthology to a human protein) n=1 Tax=Nippostrongylus brasiliensis TaxID=27835 RepID=A0A158R073_NIPBR|nr:unnamed protein product [Nippostrongylus brasiliensis]
MNDISPFRSLFTPQLNTLLDLFKKNNFELRIAGGAVRDLLMGIKPVDVDFATTATPTEMKMVKNRFTYLFVQELFNREQIRMLHKRGSIWCAMGEELLFVQELFNREQIRMLHKRGEEHGTITCRIDDAENFEITTLRCKEVYLVWIDLVCDGRRAEVQYTTDWQLDANRRDLTINSLFLDLDGNVIDYFGGINDIEKRRVAFVGDAVQRIQEDYLRILRYFRFFGRISSSSEHESETLAAIKENSEGLADISAERIWTELKRIVVGRLADHVIRCMLEECKLSKYLGLPEKCNVDRFARVFSKYQGSVEPMTMVASLCETRQDIELFHKKTKLSNVERILGEFIVDHRKEAEDALANENIEWWRDRIVGMEVNPGHGKLFLSFFRYHMKNENNDSGRGRAWRQKLSSSLPVLLMLPNKMKLSGLDLVLQLARAVCADNSLIKGLETWTVPVFPVKGLDLMHAGVKSGPKMKLTLTYLFELWQKNRYEMSKEELLSHALDECIPNPEPPKTARKRRIQDSASCA